MKLLDYIVDDLIDDGVPLTREGVKDLLSVMSPAQITPLTPSQAVVADKLMPTLLVINHLQGMNWQEIADKKVRLKTETRTVAELLHEDQYPLDFVLAGLHLPEPVCRWYVLESLSETGQIWPDGGAVNLKNIDTKFDLAYVNEEVLAYLNGPSIDYSWIHIFSLPVAWSGKSKSPVSNKLFIEDLLVTLRTGYSKNDTITWINKDNQSKLLWVVDELRIEPKHYRQVEQIHESYTNLLTVLRKSTESLDAAQKASALDVIYKRLVKEFQ